MKHLMIAGNGFVGKVLARMARKEGWTVTTLSRSGTGDRHVNISDLGALRQLQKTSSPPTHVVHCASAGGGGVEAYRSVYHDGAKHLVEVFPDAHHLFTSSTSVYPQVDGSTVTESSPTEMERETGKILLKAEECVLQANGTVARLAGIYGVGRSYLLKRFLAGQAEIEEEGARILNHIHHEDAASAVWFLLNHEHQARGQIYNVCDCFPKTQRETYEELSSLFGLPMPRSTERYLHSKRGWSNKAVSNQKLMDLGWLPKYPEFTKIADAIVRTL